MNHSRLSASLTIEAAYIFPIVCIIFGAIISICFYLHDIITISAVSYATVLDYSYDINNGLTAKKSTPDTDEVITNIDNVTIRNNHQNFNITVKDNSINYELTSTVLRLSKEYAYYSYANNLRLFKAISQYINHTK